MFKKLKDKIAEEVKQSPLRLPASVQQHLSQVRKLLWPNSKDNFQLSLASR